MSLQQAAPAGRLRDHLEQLAGQRCSAHSRTAEQYFAWPRTTVFRGTSASSRHGQAWRIEFRGDMVHRIEVYREQ
jgi:hypothetical protein